MWQAICSHSLKEAASPLDQIHVKVYDSERDKVMGMYIISPPHSCIVYVTYNQFLWTTPEKLSSHFRDRYKMVFHIAYFTREK